MCKGVCGCVRVCKGVCGCVCMCMCMCGCTDLPGEGSDRVRHRDAVYGHTSDGLCGRSDGAVEIDTTTLG